MKELPLAAKIYILLVTCVSLAAVLYSAYITIPQPALWIAILIVAAVVAGLDAIPIQVYGTSVEMTISNVVKFAAVLLFPPSVPILATFLGTLAGELPVKRPWFKKIFNISALTLTLAIVAAIYAFFHQPQYDFLESFQNVFALVLAGLTDFVASSILVSLVISLASQQSFWRIWSQNSPRVIWHDLSMIPLGIFTAALWRFNPFSVALAILPLMVVRHSYQTTNYLQRQTYDALHALMRVIDALDNETYDHSERVADYAKRIANALRLSSSEIEVIEPAALLHDLGKVGMESRILFKPESLTAEERKRAQQHVEIGEDLLSKFPLFEKGATLVRSHHERYDGTGYPNGLKGEAIPLGARIITVADAYQAMLSDRPYRKALSQQEAIEEMKRGSGTQFDPKVVQAFLQVIDQAE